MATVLKITLKDIRKIILLRLIMGNDLEKNWVCDNYLDKNQSQSISKNKSNRKA